MKVDWRWIGWIGGRVCREITPPPPRSVQLEWSRRGGLQWCTSDTVPVAWVDAKTWGHLIKFGFMNLDFDQSKVTVKRTERNRTTTMIFSTGDGPTTHSYTGSSHSSNPTRSRLPSTIYRYYCLYLYLGVSNETHACKCRRLKFVSRVAS